MVLSFLQILQDWLEPLPLLWVLLTWGVIRQAWSRHWRRAAGWFFPWLLLTLSTCVPLPSNLVYSMEKQWVGVDSSALPDCDAIVCLGGSAAPSMHEHTGFHLSGSADRLSTALQVASTHKAKELVLGGGGYQDEKDQWFSEADAVKAWMDQGKLSPVPVTSLGICSNTHDEATKVATLCSARGWKRVILVTSAVHMTRAEAAFIKAGVTVSCLPCNFLSSQLQVNRGGGFAHRPHTGGLLLFSAWWHEFAGWHVYRWRGWV